MTRNLIRELERRNVFKVAAVYLVAAWLIAQVADLALESFTAPEWTMTVLLIGLAVGFPIALAISWTYEVTTQGVIPETEVDRTVRITDQSGRRVDLILIVIVGVVIVFMGLERFVFSRQLEGVRPGADTIAAPAPAAVAPAPENPADPILARSIAVRPFQSDSSGPDDEFFAAAFSEELMRALAQIDGARVTGRLSSFAFRSPPPADEFAERLGVGHVVTGTILRAGDRLQVNARLFRAGAAAPVWSESWDTRVGEMRGVHAEIAGQVARVLQAPAGDALRQRVLDVTTADVEALIAYRKGIVFHRRAGAAANRVSLLRQANAHFEEAYRRAPALVAASDLYTDFFRHVVVTRAAGRLDGEIMERDAADAPRALATAYRRISEHAPTPAARIHAALDHAVIAGDWGRIGPLLDQAVQFTECAAPHWLPVAGSVFARTPMVTKVFNHLILCDPLRAQPRVHQSSAYLWTGDADRALAAARAGLDHTADPAVSAQFARSLAYLGRHDEAMRWAVDRISNADRLLRLQAVLAALRGDVEASREFETRYLGSYGPDDHGSLILAALRGERGEANRLARMIDDRPYGHVVLLEAAYDCLCGAPFDVGQTPRFAALLRDSGLPWPPATPYPQPARNPR